MKKIKFFKEYYEDNIQEAVDDWVESINPNIISVSIGGDDGTFYVAITYDTSPTEADLLKS